MISARLKKLREEAGLSQKDLAKRLDVASSTIAMYESNKRTPDANMLEKIADFFEVSVDYLLGRTRNKNNSIIEGIYNNEIIKIEIEGRKVNLTIDDIQELINKLGEVGFDVNKLINK